MWLIVGYGNLLRQDDGVGYHVAETLAASLESRQSSRDVRVMAVHQLTPELVLELAAEAVERVLFIDARRSQDRPLVMRKLDPATAGGSCGHQLEPDTLLHMAQTLYQRSPQGWLLTLASQQLDMGERFSNTAQSASRAALIMIEKILAKTTKEATK